MKDITKKAIIGGLVYCLTTFLVFVVFAAVGSTWTSPDTQEVGSGDTLTSSSWNSLLANFNNINNRTTNLTATYNSVSTKVAVLTGSTMWPAGAIMAFKLVSCPAGWVAADGTNSTPDLRGAFLRGIGGNSNGRDVARTLGDYQVDDFKSHTHQYYDNPSGRKVSEGGSHTAIAEKGLLTYSLYNTTAAGGTETRPKNVALLYCVKQ